MFKHILDSPIKVKVLLKA